MIDEYYKRFKVRDYMNEETLKSCLSKNIIDCSLGTNPFIEENLIKSKNLYYFFLQKNI